jgi:hypothetical protein
MNSFLSFILCAFILIGLLLVFRKKLPKAPHPDDPRTREELRALILGKAKRTVYTTQTGYTTNKAENRVIGLQHHYKFGKMFELAAKAPSGELPLSNGDKIAPHSKAHGLAAGRNADKLRINILKEYGIDIATMEDLEVGGEEFITRRKAELIAQIEKDSDSPSDPDDDLGGLSNEG